MRMSVSISINYVGELRCEATHGPSGATLLTDAPVDNCGKGEAFSPTDLVATALGTCMATTMGIFAQRTKSTSVACAVSVIKEMSKDAPRRIARLPPRLSASAAGFAPAARTLERAASRAPSTKACTPDVELPVNFVWRRMREGWTFPRIPRQSPRPPSPLFVAVLAAGFTAQAATAEGWVSDWEKAKTTASGASATCS